MSDSDRQGTGKTSDPLDFLKSLWAPMGLPMPGLTAPLFDAEEIDRRLAELRSVESWLNMNLNVLRMTIQGLETQKAAFGAMRDLRDGLAPGATGNKPSEAAGDAGKVAGDAAQAAMQAWWAALQQAQASAASAFNTGQDKTRPDTKSK